MRAPVLVGKVHCVNGLDAVLLQLDGDSALVRRDADYDVVCALVDAVARHDLHGKQRHAHWCAVAHG